MDIRLAYLIRNLTRNPLRTALTCAAVGLPVLILVVSVATIDGIERFLDNSARQLRLAVTNKSSIVNPLPEGHRRKIEALDPENHRILTVCGILWIGGKVENDSRQLSTMAADADTFVATFPEYKLTPQQLARWSTDKAAIVLGRATAKQFQWKEGDRITIRPSVPPYIPMEFHVVSTSPEDAPDPQTNWFRRDYWEDSIVDTGAVAGWINFFFVKCSSQSAVEECRVEIDRAFAGSIDETLTQDEKTFMNQFISQQFNLPRNLSILAGVVIFVAVMAAGNTIMMNFRERIGEFATLKAIGFGGRTIFALLQAESMLLCGAGGFFGCLVPYVLFTHTPLGKTRLLLIESIDVRPEVCLAGVLASALIGAIAALWPAWQAARMKVVTALRSIE